MDGVLSAAYFSPTRLDEALDLLGSRRLSVIAGGTDYFPSRGRAPVKTDILDVSRLEGLRGIARRADGGLRIGAATTWTDIATANLPEAFAGLRAAAREVGSIQIQNAATVAGNLCNASPAADGVPPLLTLAAMVEVANRTGSRIVPLAGFITGPRAVDLADDELLTAIHVPAPPDHARAAFRKLGSRKYLVISIAMSAAVIGVGPDGTIDHATVAVGACSPVALRLMALERDLIGKCPRDVAVTSAHLAPLSPISDIRSSAGYRLHAIRELIQRTIVQAGSRDG